VGEVGGALVGAGEGEGLGEVVAGLRLVAEAVVGEGDEEVVLGVAADLEVLLEDEEVGEGGGEVVDGGGFPLLASRFFVKGQTPAGPAC